MSKRSLFKIAKMPLWLVAYISPRLFMRLYNPLLRFAGVTVIGTPRYISPGCKFDDFDLITIGDRVVISSGTTLLTHDYSLTTGLIAISRPPTTDSAFLKPILIGSNVFIGMGVLVLPGAIVLDNTVVGAGSVVRGTVGPNSIVIGNPAVSISSLDDRAYMWKSAMDNGVVKVRADAN